MSLMVNILFLFNKYLPTIHEALKIFRFLQFSVMLLLHWTLLTSSGKHNVAVWCPSISPIDILIVTHQEAACDMASIHFGPTVRRTDRHAR